MNKPNLLNASAEVQHSTMVCVTKSKSQMAVSAASPARPSMEEDEGLEGELDLEDAGGDAAEAAATRKGTPHTCLICHVQQASDSAVCLIIVTK